MTKTNDPQETGPAEIRERKEDGRGRETRRRTGLEIDDVTQIFDFVL